MGRLILGQADPQLASDAIVEADGHAAFDAREILPDIRVPVLLVGGDRDRFTPREVYEETARLIPDCTLRIYEGKDHLRVTSDKRFARDVLDFVRQRPRVQPEQDAEQSTNIDQPAVPTDPLVRPTPSPVRPGAG